MDLHVHGNPGLHYRLNGCQQAKDDGLQFLSMEEKECILFFEETIDSLEQGFDDTTGLTSRRSTPAEGIGTSSNSALRPALASNVSPSLMDHDIIDLVHSPTNFTVPDFHNLALTPEPHYETIPKKERFDPSSTTRSDAHEENSHPPPPGSVPTPVVIASKISEHQGTGGITPSTLLGHRCSLESKRDRSVPARTPNLPSKISMTRGNREISPHSIATAAVNIQERRSQMLANLPAGSHPLEGGEPACMRNLPTRSVSFKDMEPEKSRMEALSKLGLMGAKTPNSTASVVSKGSSSTTSPNNSAYKVSSSASSPISSANKVSSSAGSPTSNANKVSSSASSPISSANKVSSSASSPTSSANKVSCSASSPTSSANKVSCSASLPTSSTNKVSSSAGSPTSSANKVSCSASLPTSSANKVSSSASSPISSANKVSSSAGLPTSSANKVSSSASSPISSANKVSSSAGLPISSANKVSSSASLPTSSANKVSSSASSPISSANKVSSSAGLPISSANKVSSSASLPTSSANKVSSSASSPISISNKVNASTYGHMSNNINTSSNIGQKKNSNTLVLQSTSTLEPKSKNEVLSNSFNYYGGKSAAITPVVKDTTTTVNQERRSSIPPASAEVKQTDFNSYGGKSIILNPTMNMRAESASASATISEPETHFNSYGGRSRVINPLVSTEIPDEVNCAHSHSTPNTVPPTTYHDDLTRSRSPSEQHTLDAKPVVRTRPATLPPPTAPRPQFHTGSLRPRPDTVPPEILSKPAPSFRNQGVTVQFSGKGTTGEARRDALRRLGLLKNTS